MKNLRQFLDFNWDGFARDKIFSVTGISEFKDYESQRHLGSKVDTAITNDGTKYLTKDGSTVTNLYEKVSFKVKKDVNVPINAKVLPVNPVVTVYGEYLNQLSIVCDDIVIVDEKGKNHVGA